MPSASPSPALAYRLTIRLLPLALGLVMGCGNQPFSFPRSSFDRPAGVAFVCSRPDRTFVEPGKCRFDSTGEGERGDLIALVTQSARGEVAAVNLVSREVQDTERRVPGHTFVPVGEAPTAIVTRWPVVGSGKSTTYVASFAYQNVMAIDSAVFLTKRDDERSGTGARPSTAECTDEAPCVELGGGPVDMLHWRNPEGGAATQADEALFVAVPDTSSVMRVPLRGDAGTMGEPSALALDSTVPAAPAPDEVATSAQSPELCIAGEPRKAGPYAPAPAVDLRGSLEDFTGVEPRPAAVALDPVREQLLVADAALPILHVLDLVSGKLLEPIVTGAPTRALVVTPLVLDAVPEPEQAGAGTSPGVPTKTRNYAYAIDARDGSVLVVDLERRRLLQVDEHPGRRPDRIHFHSLPLAGQARLGAGGALTLEVLTPGCELQEQVCVPPMDPGESDARGLPTVLRGVLVAVALADGSVRYVDVYDLDAHKRCQQEPQEIVYQRRHRPRLIWRLTTNPEDPAEEEFRKYPRARDAQFRIDGISQLMQINGRTDTPVLPDLLRVPAEAAACGAPLSEGCPEGMTAAAFDQEPCGDNQVRTTPLICLASDPWYTNPQGWGFSFEGRIPGTQGGRGQLELGSVAMTTQDKGMDFCARGVLDRETIRDLGGNPGQGDQLVITSRLQPEQMPPGCDVLDQKMPVAFAIQQAYRELLVLSARLRTDARLLSDSQRSALEGARCGGASGEPLTTFAGVHCCLAGKKARDQSVGDPFVSYEVRSLDSYIVEGETSGFTHTVGADAKQRCRADTSEDAARRRSRAFEGQLFRNHDLALKFGTPPEAGGEQETRKGFGLDAFGQWRTSLSFQFNADNVPQQLMSDLGGGLSRAGRNVHPVALRFNPIDQRLYIVDAAFRGLMLFNMNGLGLDAEYR